jgi:hypothetical protein
MRNPLQIPTLAQAQKHKSTLQTPTPLHLTFSRSFLDAKHSLLELVMAALRLPHFQFSPSKPVHEPLVGDYADSTLAATSLESGTFQYVSSDFLSDASAFLSQVSASVIDPSSGYVYLLRRANPTEPRDPNIVILDANGKILRQIKDEGITCGHSVKLINGDQGSLMWVVDKGSRSLRIYSLDGDYKFSIGPEINPSVSFGEV